MAENEYGFDMLFLGWFSDGGSHDKVWGFALIGSDNYIYNFWGRRGKKYTFKRYDSVDELETLKWSKIRKGYKSVPKDNIERIIPGFNEEFTTQLGWAKLCDKFHGFGDN